MEFLFITPYTNPEIFEAYLRPSLSKIKVRCAQISDKEGSNGIKTISDKYNIGVSVVSEQGLITDDLVLVFVKENVHILDDLIIEKLNHIFTEMPDIGVVGVMGVKELVNHKDLYDSENKPVNGIVFKPMNDDNDNGAHVRFTKNGFFENIIGVDDSLFAIKAATFDDDSFKFISGLNAGFGIDIAVKAISIGLDVVVADILVVSESDNNVPFPIINDIIIGNDVSEYPVSVKNFNINTSNILEVEI